MKNAKDSNIRELDAIIKELRNFVDERDWSKFHDPKNLSMAVISEAGELVDILRWISSDEVDMFVNASENRNRIAAEIADIAIFLLLLCDRLGMDILDIVREKIAINKKNHPVELTRGHSKRVRPINDDIQGG